MHRVLAAGLMLASMLWVVLLIAAPLTLSGGSVLAALFYEACGLICHQRPERSFHLAGLPLPVCARCFGLYASGAAGAAAAWLVVQGEGGSSRYFRRLLLWTAIPTAVTLLGEWSGLAGFSPLTRALAAIPLGAALGWLLVSTVRSNLTHGEMRYHA
ncbi:MAG TPA: DUF2085 domain-containing protein [Vicinamibacterales bacterium]|nr:DUF2085 domain-containing protein [Vicinamibacterales bacterium]